MAIRVMVVDDTKFMRIMLAEILRKLGCDVVAEVENGKNAIMKYKELRPDLVMMDITMPEMDGITATREIRLIDPEAIIIICSAGSQEELIGEAINAGATTYLMKPFMPEKVKEIFDTVAPFLRMVSEEAVWGDVDLEEEKQVDQEDVGQEEVLEEQAIEFISEEQATEFMPEESVQVEMPDPSMDEIKLEAATDTDTEVEAVSEVVPTELEASSLAESTVKAATEQVAQIREHSSNSNVIQLNKGVSAVNNFSSSYMCNWNEEVEAESVRFLALYADGDRLLNIEMLKADGQRQSIKVSIEGFRQLNQWLEDKVPNNLSGYREAAN